MRKAGAIRVRFFDSNFKFQNLDEKFMAIKIEHKF